MLIASQIERSYQSLKILKGIDLQIQKKEIVVIVGASGAGKSTLLHILGTLDRPDKGSVWLNGVDVYGLSEEKLAEFRNQQIGFIFQFHNLMAEFTALENVCMPAFIAGQGQQAKARGQELLQMLGLAKRAHHLPSQLSGGEQQRVAVARALINEPAIVFADEPSGNLDSTNARELHELFLDLRERLGQTFVIVTHDETLAAMADRKIVMQDGHLKQ